MGHQDRRHGSGHCTTMTGADLEAEGRAGHPDFAGGDYPHPTNRWRDDRPFKKDPSFEWVDTHNFVHSPDDEAATIHTETIATTMKSLAEDEGYFEPMPGGAEVEDPAVSEKQRRFMGAELRRKRAGKKTRTGMTEKQLRDYASKG